MATRGGEIVFNLSVNSTEMVRGLKRAQDELKSTNMTTRMMGISIQRAGASVAKGARAVGTAMATVSASIAGAGLIAVKTASDWETAFTDVSKVLDPTKTNIKALEKELLNMSKVIPLATEELAEVAASAGRLGIEGEKNILKFTEVVSAMGVATNMTAEEAGDAMARFANVMNMPITDVDRLGSAIVNLGNNLPTTEREITKMGTRMASAGRQANLSEAEVMSFAGALSATGVSAERGGTNMSLFLRTVANATKEGGDKLAVFAKVSGKTSSEFKKHFQKDASGAIVDFLKGLNEMEKNGVSTADVFKDLGINGQIMHEVLGNLSGNIGLVEDALEYGNKGWEENRALMDEAKQRYETFASLVQLVKNRFKYLGIVIGKEIITVLSSLIKAMMPVFDMLDKFVDWFAQLSEPVKKATIYLGMAVSAFFGLGAIMAFVVAGIASVISLMGLFLAGASAIGLTLSGLIAISLSVVGGLLLIGTAIGGLVGLFALMVTKSEGLRDALSNAFQGIGNKVTFVVDNIKLLASNLWGQIKDFWERDISNFVSKLDALFKPMLDKISSFGDAEGLVAFSKKVVEIRIKVEKAFAKMLEFLGNALEFMGNVLERSAPMFERLYESAKVVFFGFVDIVKEAFSIAVEVIRYSLDAITTFWETNGDNIMNAVKTIFPFIEAIIKGAMVAIKLFVIPTMHSIKNVITGALDIILGAVAIFGGFFEDGWSGVWDGVKRLTKGVFKVLIGLLDLMLFRGMLSKARALISPMKGIFQTTWSAIKSILSFDFRGLITRIWSAIPKFFSTMWSNILGIFGAAIVGVINVWTSGFDGMVSFVTGIVNGVINAFTSLWDGIINIVSTIVNHVLGFFQDMYMELVGNSIIPDMVDAILDWIDHMRTLVIEFVQNMVQGVIDFFVGLYDGVLGFVSNTVTGVIDFFVGMYEGVIEIVSSILTGVVEFFVMMWEGITSTVSNIAESVREGFELVSEIIHNVMDSVLGIIETILTYIYETFMNALDLVIAVVTGDFEAIKNVMNSQMSSAKDLLVGIWENIKTMFGEKVEAILTGVEEKFIAIRDAMAEIIENAREKVIEIVGNLYGEFIALIEAIPAGILNLGSVFMEAGVNIVKSLGDGIKGAFDYVTGPIQDLAGQIRDYFPFSPAKVGPLTDIHQIDFGGTIGDAIRNSEVVALTALANLTNNMKNVVTSFLGKIGDMFTQGFAKVGSITTSAMKSVATAMTSGFKSLTSITTSSMKGVGNAIKSAFTSITSNIGNSMKASSNVIKASFSSINGVVKSATRNMTSTIKSSFSSIGSNIKSSMSSTTSLMRSSFNSISSNVRSVMTSINSNIRSSFNTMSNTSRTALNTIRSSMTSAWKTISSTTRSQINSMVTTSTSRLRSFASSVRSSFTSVRNAVSSGMRSAVSTANSAMSGFVSAGRRVGSSVASGIRGSIGAVRSAASSMASSIRRFLPFSPAKEGALKDIMKVRIGESVAEAIKRGTPTAITAMAKLSDEINKGLIVDSTKIKKGVEGSFKKLDGGVKVDYASPQGTHSTLTSVVKGSIKEDSRDDKIVEAINSLENRLGDLEVVMDGEQVGRIVRPHVNHGNAVDNTIRYF